MIERGTICWPTEDGEMFDRAQLFTTTPGQNGWTIADTSAAGTPTYLTITEDGGAAKLTMAATSEAENVCLYQNDVLAFDLRQIKLLEFTAKVGALDSASAVVMGLGSARNDTTDSVTVNAWFKIDGSVSTSNVVCECDDDVTNVDDIASGTTLSTTYKKFAISFEKGLSDVRFFIDGQRVASAQTFNMSGLAAGLNVQPIFQIQKASGTGVGYITIARVRVEYAYAYGA